MFREIIGDGGFELADAAEGAATNALARDRPKESFDLIDPRRACGCEVNLVTRVPGQPAADLGRFVRSVVVHDEVNLHAWFLGNGSVDSFEKLDELLLAMLPEAFADHLAGGDIHQRRRVT